MTGHVSIPIYAEYDFDLHHIATIEFGQGEDIEAFIAKLRPVLASLAA